MAAYHVRVVLKNVPVRIGLFLIENDLILPASLQKAMENRRRKQWQERMLTGLSSTDLLGQIN